MSNQKLNIKGVVKKVNFAQKQFVIARIIKSNHDVHRGFSFKGFSNTTLKEGDCVLITKGKFIETDYGTQLEKGSLRVIGKEEIIEKTNSPEKYEHIEDELPSPVPKDIHREIILTNEQKDCINAAQQGYDIKIKAYAGTGKTSTLVEISKRLVGRGLYLAYNKAIQLDASDKFPSQVACKTAHSLAYGGLYSEINGRVENLTPITLMSNISITSVGGYQAYEVAFLTLKMLREFSNTSGQFIDESFMHNEQFIMVGDNDMQRREIMRYVIDKASEYWFEAIKEGSKIPIEHDFYLKMYQLSEPDLSKRFDYILFDECQDANPVLIDILSKQTSQKVFVGDEHQQIYSWRGAVNSYDQFEGQAYYLSQSFRFGNKIAELASIILYIKGERTPLTGRSDIDSVIVENKPKNYTHLCRTNANMIAKIIENVKKKIHVVGGTREILDLAKSGFALYQGDAESNKHSKIRSFKSWDKLIEFKEKFEDPDISFLAKIIEKHGEKFGGIIHQIENANYVKEDQATVVFSTIHKAKGREWDHVVIGDDFSLFTSEDDMQTMLREDSEEFNLLYVAITRAKYSLHLERDCERFLNRLKSYCKPIIERIKSQPIVKKEIVSIELLEPSKEEEPPEDDAPDFYDGKTEVPF